MPINMKMMKAMKKEYGAKEGKNIYYAKENKEGKLKQNDGVKDPKETEESVATEAKESGQKKTSNGSAKAALRHTLGKMFGAKIKGVKK